MFTPLLAFELDFYWATAAFLLAGIAFSCLVYALALALDSQESGGAEVILPPQQRATAQPEYREPAMEFRLPEKFGPRFQYPLDDDLEN